MTKKKPLTPSEVQKAADQFFPLYKIVLDQMPTGATAEDTLKCFEAINKLALFNRTQEPKGMTFGFNKPVKDNEETKQDE